ncbi:MAG: MBL fold metallo-hydrolase [Sciscionella sp.]
MLGHVAEDVLVHESEFCQSNAVVVQGRAGVLLIDAGVTGHEMTCLANDLRESGQPVVEGFSTHPHWDHLLWHTSRGSAPRYGTARCVATVRDRLSGAGATARIAKHLIPPDIADQVPLELLGLIAGLPADMAQIPWDGPQVRIIEHRAHAPGHAALVIEERGVLVAGDMLSDVLIPLLDLNGAADPIEDYLAALRLLEDTADDVDVLVPGHGSIGGADQVRARIDQDRAYLHTYIPCVTPAFPATRRSAHRPRTARIGCLACTHGNSSASAKQARATRRPASDRSPVRIAARRRKPITLIKSAAADSRVPYVPERSPCHPVRHGFCPALGQLVLRLPTRKGNPRHD